MSVGQESAKDLRYLDNEDKFLDFAFEVLSRHFKDRSHFESFFGLIPTDVEKNEFLRIASFYKFLVVHGEFRNKDKRFNSHIEYLDTTYKYIAIFALIESIYERDAYLNFYPWLTKRRKETDVFPIDSSEKLSKLYDQYLSEHGATRKAVRFFESLDDRHKDLLKEKLKVLGEDKPILYLAKTLYRIRSDFVHKGKLVLLFDEGSAVARFGNKTLFSELTLEDLKTLFEHGMLKHYGCEEFI